MRKRESLCSAQGFNILWLMTVDYIFAVAHDQVVSDSVMMWLFAFHDWYLHTAPAWADDVIYICVYMATCCPDSPTHSHFIHRPTRSFIYFFAHHIFIHSYTHASKQWRTQASKQASKDARTHARTQSRKHTRVHGNFRLAIPSNLKETYSRQSM